MGSAIVYTMVFILVNSVAHSSYHYENLPAAGYMTLSNGEIYDPFTSTDPNAPPGDLSYDFDSHAPTAGLGIYPDAEFPDIYFDPSDIPSEVDWSRFYPTPGNQGNQGSCLGWCAAYASAYFQARLSLADPNSMRFSPAYVYNQTKELGCLQGSLPYKTLNFMKNQGVAPDAMFPYHESSCSELPNASVHSEAAKHRIDRWTYVDGYQKNHIQANVLAGNPVLVGLRGDFDFFGAYNHDGVYTNAHDPSRRLASHGALIVGYSNDRQAFKLINSWGTAWGEGGLLWISYDVMATMVMEMYAIQRQFNSLKYTWDTTSSLQGDFNGDGRQDVLLHVYEPEIGLRITKVLQASDGDMIVQEQQIIAPWADERSYSLAGDFNGDDLDDLLYASLPVGENATLSVSRSHHTGESTPVSTLSTSYPSEEVTDILVEDINADGIDDVLLVKRIFSTQLDVVSYFGSDTGLEEGAIESLSSPLGAAFSPSLQHMNEDAYPDLVFVAQENSLAVYYVGLGMGDGRFFPLMRSETTLPLAGPFHELKFIDLDGFAPADLHCQSAFNMYASQAKPGGGFLGWVPSAPRLPNSYLNDFNQDGQCDKWGFEFDATDHFRFTLRRGNGEGGFGAADRPACYFSGQGLPGDQVILEHDLSMKTSLSLGIHYPLNTEGLYTIYSCTDLAQDHWQRFGPQIQHNPGAAFQLRSIPNGAGDCLFWSVRRSP